LACSNLNEAPSSAMITWSKDGQPLQSNGKVTIQDQGKVLMVDHVQREDAGMYQCLIRTDDDSAQGTAEIRLGGEQNGGKGEFPEGKVQCFFVIFVA
jgi:Immunoglobulin I-set domain